MDNQIELDAAELEEDRYSRLRLIPWWDQEKLKHATIMVVGAGAIGNELIKNLALLGIGRILIFDMDDIENTNHVALLKSSSQISPPDSGFGNSHL